MSKQNKKTLIRIIVLIVLVVIILLLLKFCGKRNENEVVEKTDIQVLLTEMKVDEEKLVYLFERSDICSSKWADELIEHATKIQSYKYSGDDSNIVSLIDDYKKYGIELDKIARLMKEGKFEESIVKLEELEELALKIENDLGVVYNEYY